MCYKDKRHIPHQKGKRIIFDYQINVVAAAQDVEAVPDTGIGSGSCPYLVIDDGVRNHEGTNTGPVSAEREVDILEICKEILIK